MLRYILNLLLLLPLCHLNAQQPKYNYRIFPASALVADFDTLYHQLKANHADLYGQISERSADSLFLSIRTSLTTSMNRLEYSRTIAPFLTAFNDGHTFLDVQFDGDEELDEYTSKGGGFFPVKVRIIGGRLYCTDTAFRSTGLQSGDEITELNGVKAAAVINGIRSLFPGDNTEAALATVERLFGYGLWRYAGWGEDVVLSYRNNGRIKSSKVSGVSKDNYLQVIFGQGSPFRLHLHPAVSLAVLEINSYSNYAKAKAFIDSSFRVIGEQKIKNVALDLRKNGGGNSGIGDLVLAYVTTQPYQATRSKTWRIGPLAEALPPASGRGKEIAQARTSWQKTGVDRFTREFDPQLPLPAPTAGEHRLTAEDGKNIKLNFYVLISRRTFSSAHMTAQAVKCGRIGTLIGQPTGERLGLTGEVLSFQLPQTGIFAICPGVLFAAACGDDREVGVKPDHYIPVTPATHLGGGDPELDFLVKLIKKSDRTVDVSK